VNRLQKFVEEDADGPSRIAYAFGADRLPPAKRGKHWEPVRDFNAAEELFEKRRPQERFSGCHRRRLRRDPECRSVTGPRPAGGDPWTADDQKLMTMSI
jgi:hypothetical protein